MLQAMKDYADQQRRLLQDISNLMLRNRDLLRQREEEQRQRAALQAEAQRVAAEAEAVDAEPESAEEHDVPAVVALDDVVPQLIVPNDAGKHLDVAELQRELDEAARNTAPESTVEKEQGEAAVEPTVEIERDSPERLLGAGRKGDSFRLDLPLTSKIMTLESPAFIPESVLPVVEPPSEEEAARAAAEAAAAVQPAGSPEYNPVEFPPSPMVGTARPVTFVQLSPNTRRKFVISRVQESASPVTKHTKPIAQDTKPAAAKHSTDSHGASTSSEQPTSSAFQSGSNGNQGSSDSHVDVEVEDSSRCDKEPVSLPDNRASVPSSDPEKDLNENPTEQCTASLSADDVTVSATTSHVTQTTENAHGAKTATVRSNDIVETTTGGDNATTNDKNHNTTPQGVKLPDFHTNLSLNGLKVELANVIDSIDKSSSSETLPSQTEQLGGCFRPS